MNKLLLGLLVLPLILSSCSSDKALAPMIVLQSVAITQDSTVNYKDSLENLPILNVGDEVELELFLDGNGSALNTLNVSGSNKNIEILLIPSVEALITGNTNFTDLEKGRAGFVDDVANFKMKTRLKVVSTQDGGTVKLTFHLSARAECESGGVLELTLKTGDIFNSKIPVSKQ